MDSSITTGGINELMAVFEHDFETQPLPQSATMAAKRLGDPLWAVVLMLLGSFVLVGAGAFLVTVGLSR